MPATLPALPVPPAEQGRSSGSDFAPLARRVRESGLMDRRRGYYVRAIGLNLAATAAVWGAVAWV
ncbi:acyl-CoA desaturase, partial [Actinomadura sp. 7K507]